MAVPRSSGSHSMMVSDRSHLLLNAALFQLTWFGCVLGGAVNEPVWGLLALGVLAAMALSRGKPGPDLRMVILLGATGFALDSLWIATGLLTYGDHTVAPVWVVALWLGVALTVNHSLAWLRNRPGLAAVLAAVAAPFTYLAGERLGAVQVPAVFGLAVVSAAWAALFALLFARAPVPTDGGFAGGARE